jgi:NitT/TauT family transport system substrate-binding protein
MHRRLVLLCVGILVLTSSGIFIAKLAAPKSPLPHVTLITTRTPFSAAIFLAKERGWFEDAGVSVNVLERATGKEGLDELIDGTVDYATASDTAIMFSLLNAPPMKVVATVSISTDNLTIVARRDRGIESSLDLQGKRIGFAIGTNSQYFLDTFLEFRSLKPEAVLRVPLKPDELVQALIDGKVDAISTWTPLNRQAMEALGTKGHELRAGNAFRWSWNLVSRNESVARNATTPLILSALIRASRALKVDPQTCARDLAPTLEMSTEQLLQAWGHTLFDVTLDQSLILSLEMQARWAMGTSLTEHKNVPNFLPAISSQALRMVDSRAVTLIDGNGHR